MTGVKEGDKIHVVCEAKLEDGQICFKNEKEEPLELIVGEGKFFPAIEKKLQNMKKGETKTITLEPEEAFGPHVTELVLEVPKDAFKPDVTLSIGLRIKIDTPSGKMLIGTIIAISDEKVTIDFNHPLSGKKILFAITVISIEKK